MDSITNTVRAMYERFPYPPQSAPELRVGSSARVLLSHGRTARPGGRPITVLDAGCGRAVGMLGAAMLQPDVRFVGADMNRVALAEAAEQAELRGLTNVSFVETDLMTMQGLAAPPGGFDVITSSGVLHHLSSPARGLSHLVDMLAPHGMLSVMVYGRAGREAVHRTARAIDLLIPRERPLGERFDVARRLLRSVRSEAILAGPFADAAQTPDAELADRYLHPNETSYDVPGLFKLLAGAGLAMLRWNEPEHWDVRALIADADLVRRANALPDVDRYALVEQLAYRPTLDLVACRVHNGPRAPLDLTSIDDARLAVNPEASFVVETRAAGGQLRTENIRVQLRRSSMAIAKGPLGAAALIARDQTESFKGAELVRALGGFGVEPAEARAAVLELARLEVLYAPHPVDA